MKFAITTECLDGIIKSIDDNNFFYKTLPLFRISLGRFKNNPFPWKALPNFSPTHHNTAYRLLFLLYHNRFNLEKALWVCPFDIKSIF